VRPEPNLLMLRPSQRRSRAALEKLGSRENARTIIIALAANVIIAAAKVRPSTRLSAEELTRAMDDLDRALRQASPFVADVYIDVTATSARRDGAATPARRSG
jgi:chorismate-pyruvate lyase